jgi:hypothetical protein
MDKAQDVIGRIRAATLSPVPARPTWSLLWSGSQDAVKDSFHY